MDPILDQGTDQRDLGLGQITRSDLYEAARWAKFLAIVGFVSLGLLVLMGVFFLVSIGSMSGYFGNNFGLLGGGIGFGLYILMAVLYFFPTLYLYRFANNAMIALNSENQGALDYSITNLKAMFKYIGILTVIVLSFYALGILFGILMGVGSMF